MNASCTYFTAEMCGPYRECYPSKPDGDDVACSCTRFYGYELNRVTNECERAKTSTILGVIGAVAVLSLCAYTIVSTFGTLIRVYRLNHSAMDAKCVILSVNLIGCIAGFLSCSAMSYTFHGQDDKYIAHDYVRPISLSVNMGCMMLADTVIYLGWKETSIRCAKVSMRNTKMTTLFRFSSFLLYFFCLAVPVMYLVLEFHGLRIISVALISLFAFLVAGGIKYVGYTLSKVLLVSTSPTIVACGERIDRYSTRFSTIHFGHAVCVVAFLVTAKIPEANIAPLIFYGAQDYFSAWLRWQISKYFRSLMFPRSSSRTGRKSDDRAFSSSNQKTTSRKVSVKPKNDGGSGGSLSASNSLKIENVDPPSTMMQK